MLSDEEKATRKRDRMIDKARQYSTGTYIRKFVSIPFQRMIRAEEAALPPGPAPAIVNGELRAVLREVGQCVCVTCGKVQPWSGGLGGMHAGHFLASRRNSILFEESNVWPQCSHCNRYESGNPQAYRLWMEAVHGAEVIERLRKLKETSVQFSRDELVDMRIEFAARLKAAEDSMRNQP